MNAAPPEVDLARLSHELRTPLNAVIGFSRILEANRAGNQRPEDIELLRRIRICGERLLGVAEGVLAHIQADDAAAALETTKVTTG